MFYLYNILLWAIRNSALFILSVTLQNRLQSTQGKVLYIELTVPTDGVGIVLCVVIQNKLRLNTLLDMVDSNFMDLCFIRPRT
jgi:hypothetical protein